MWRNPPSQSYPHLRFRRAGTGSSTVGADSRRCPGVYAFTAASIKDKQTIYRRLITGSSHDRHRHRSLPSLCRHRHPIGPQLLDAALHREAEESSAACWSRNCWRSASPMLILTSTATSMQRSRPMPTSRYRSSAFVRTWIRRPTSPGQTSSRKWCKTTAVATSSFRDRSRSFASTTIRRCATRSATTSSRPTARRCLAPTTRPALPKS